MGFTVISMKARRCILLAIVCLCGVPAAVGADVIVLMNGVRVVGTVVDATRTAVVVKVGGSEVRIRPDRVRSITFGDQAPVAAAKPEPVPASEPARSQQAAVTFTTIPSAPPRPPRPLSEQVRAALAALDKLQTATESALAPADYTARVAEVRRVVEQALDAGAEESDVRSAIAAAVDYHALAALAGTIYERRGDLAVIGRDAVVTECRALGEQITREAEQLKLNPSNPALIGLLTATEGAMSLRVCAGEKIAEAEALAKAPR
jgi:hypothetical protein